MQYLNLYSSYQGSLRTSGMPSAVCTVAPTLGL